MDAQRSRRPMTPRSISQEQWLNIYSERLDTGCIIFTGRKNQHGYGDVRSSYGKKGWPRRAHRLAWILANGPIPKGLLVCHTCDVRACINPDHLFLGTNADNLRDMTAKGRRATGDMRGVNNGRAKITEEQVRAIRSDGRSYPIIAAAYGLSRTQVGAIVRRETWSHLVEE